MDETESSTLRQGVLRLRPERSLLREVSTEEKEKLSELQSKWDINEMRLTMIGLEEYGLTRIISISERLMYKTPEQVKGWLWRMGKDAYKMRRQNAELEGMLVDNSLCSVGVSIARRDKFKGKRSNTRHLSAISKSLLMIENLEKHPTPSSPDCIDFKQLYNMLYMAMKGYPLPKTNDATLRFFIESLHYLLKVASSDPISSFLSEDDQVLKSISKSPVLNPQSIEINNLKGKIDDRLVTVGYDVKSEMLSSWLSKQDWNCI